MESELSDSELRRRLKEHGVDAGPITDSTRKVYLKKLNQLVSGIPAKNRRKSTPPRSAKAQPSLLEYSSEDSEIDSAQSSNRRSRRRTLQPGQLQVSISRDLLATPSTSGNDDSAVFKVPTPVSPVGRNTRSSNVHEDTPYPHYSTGGSLTRAKLRSGRRSTSSFEIDSSDSDADFDRRRRSGVLRLGPAPRNSGDSSDNRGSWLFFRNRSALPKSAENNLHHHAGKQNGGQLEDSSFESEFQVADVPRSSANHSHLISMFLLCLITVFFIVVGMLYVGVKQDSSMSSGSLENFTDLICKGFYNIDDDCIEKEDLPLALKATRSLHSALSVAAGEYECSLNQRQSRWVPVNQVKLQLQSLYPELRNEELLDKILNKCTLLIKKHSEWGIRILREDVSSAVRAFEAANAQKSLWCRLKLSVQAVFYQAVLVATAVLSILGVFVFGRVYKKRKQLRQQQIYELVEDILDILRDHHEKSSDDKSNGVEASVPIIHVRDMLIPPSERKEKQNLWDEAVHFVKENESRVLTERKRLVGEEFLAWRWIQQTSPAGSKNSKLWQGQAFGSSGKGVNFLPFSPTPCLKIRNMFDASMEFGNNWQVTIQDAILEKCHGNNGIVHMVVDNTSEDGCVYIKFSSSEAAGQAYRSLHGWWFDSKLLTVKYMRLERYLMRFPDSANHTTPLRPSNNMQFSLQGGSPISPLESS